MNALAGNADRSWVLKQAHDQQVKFVRLWFTDILGYLKSITVTRESLEDALTEGEGFDGSSIDGLARDAESDLVAMPDPATFAVLPWRGKEQRVARVFADILSPDGSHHACDPRHILRRQLERARAFGYTFYASAELEFFLLRSDAGAPEPVDGAGYFDQDPSDSTTDVRREIILTLEEMGIAVDSSHHEGAPGQHEIDLQYADGLTMADAIQTARLVIKEAAQRRGMYATFMPRPINGSNGSGMHVGLSLYRDDQNAFFQQEDPLRLSPVGRSFVAGILRAARAVTAVLNQWVNSYKRLVPGTEAPVYVSWAATNRADLVRIPATRPGHVHSMRVEIRSPDAACNPYLALAVLLAAGLDGVEQGLTPPAAVTRNVFEMSDQERAAIGIERLPQDLREAIVCAEKSELLARVLGPALDVFLKNKRIEWEAYGAHVSDWEIGRYLRRL